MYTTGWTQRIHESTQNGRWAMGDLEISKFGIVLR